MKWERTDFVVGSVVVAAVVIALGSFLWLSPALSARTYPLYTFFDRIDGLNSGANVVLQGYSVGQVGVIEPQLDAGGNMRFRVQMNLQYRLASGDSLFLPQGTRARLMPPAVIGNGFIMLEPPDGPAPRLEPGSTVPGTRATAVLEQVQGITDELTAEVVETLRTTRSLMDTLTLVAGQATLAMGHTNRLMSTTTERLPSILAGLESQLATAEALTRDLREQVNTLAPAAAASIDTATALLSDSRRLVVEMNQLLSASEPEMTGILANLDTTMLLLQHFVRQVSRRPYRMLTGVKPPPGLDPPPPGPPVDTATAETAGAPPP